MITLTPEDWAEIYYALDTKSAALRRGDYAPEDASGEDVRWITHLEAIKDKIGPDGVDAASKGVESVK